MSLSRDEVIHRLCELQARVTQEVIGFQHAADCICTSEKEFKLRTGMKWQNQGKSLEFIEQAVQEKIDRVRREKMLSGDQP